MNEIAQWFVLVTTLMMVVALYVRHSMDILDSGGDIASRSGPRRGRRLKSPALERIESESGRLGESTSLLFVSEGCMACGYFLEAYESRSEGADPLHRLVLVAARPSAGFEAALRRLGLPLISDHDGQLWRTLDIQATPFAVHLDAEGNVVEAEVPNDPSALLHAPDRPTVQPQGSPV